MAISVGGLALLVAGNLFYWILIIRKVLIILEQISIRQCFLDFKIGEKKGSKERVEIEPEAVTKVIKGK